MLSTGGTFARCALPSGDLLHALAPFPGDILHNLHELPKAQITDLAPPHRFHAREVQVLKHQHVERIAQIVRELEVIVPSFIRNADMRSYQQPRSFATVVRPFGLLVLATRKRLDTLQFLLVEQWRHVGFARVVGEKCFQAKVKSRHFTGRGWTRFKRFLNHTEAQPQAPQTIPFDGQGFNLAHQIALFGEFVGLAADPNLVAFKQPVARLFKRKRWIALDFPEFGWTFGDTFEKTGIGVIEAFQHILNRLRTERFPEAVALSFHAQTSNMGFEPVQRNVFSREGVIPLVQSEGMIPDTTRHVDLLMQKDIAFVAAIKAILVGSANGAILSHALVLTRQESPWVFAHRDWHISYSSTIGLVSQRTTRHVSPYLKVGLLRRFFDKLTIHGSSGHSVQDPSSQQHVTQQEQPARAPVPISAGAAALREKRDAYLSIVIVLIPIVLLESLFLYIDRQPGYLLLVTAAMLVVSLLLLRRGNVGIGVAIMFLALWMVGPLSLLLRLRPSGISILTTVGYLFLGLVIAQTAFSRRIFYALTILTFIGIFFIPLYPLDDPRGLIFSLILVLLIWMIITVFAAMNRIDRAARQVAEDALREDEERYRVISELLSDYVFKLRVMPDGTLTPEWTTGGVHKMLGEEVPDRLDRNKSITEVLHPDDLPEMATSIAIVLNGGKDVREFRVLGSTGSVHWVRIYTRGERNAQTGKVDTIYGAAQDITERKLAEQELVESRKRYEELVNSIDGVVWEANAESRETLFVSKQIEAISGYRAEQFVHDPILWLNIIHPDDYERAISVRTRAVQEQRNFQNEYRLVAADGRIAWIRDNVTLMFRKDNQLIMRGISINMTESKIAQMAEEEQRRLYDALRETTAVITASLDLDEVLDRILDQLFRVIPTYTSDIVLIGEDGYGYLARDRGFVENNLPQVEPRDKIPIHDMPTFRRMMETGESNTVRDTHSDPLWSFPELTPWVRSTVGSPIRLDGQTIGFLHLTSNRPNAFTERDENTLTAFADQVAIAIRNARLYEQVRRYAEMLEEQVKQRTAELNLERERASVMLDSTGDGILYTENSRMLYLNPALCEMLGYSEEELVGRHIGVILADPSREHSRQLLQDIGVALLRDKVWRGESQLRRKNGETFYAGITTSLLSDGEQSFRAVTLVRDISKEKALQKQQSNLVAFASHELRTPITNLKTRLYLLRRRPENLEQHLEILDQVTERMKRLVEDLLDISRMERGVIPLKRQIMNIESQIQEIVATQQPEAERKGLHFTYVPPDQPIFVEADSERLAQVVTNLITNAINYTPADGTIQIAIQPVPAENYVEIQVSDTGVGIAAEHLPHIFQPFYRVVSHVDGTGLGLSIARQIAHMHGGDIRVETVVGEGSTFTLSLPMTDAPDDTSISEEYSSTSLGL